VKRVFRGVWLFAGPSLLSLVQVPPANLPETPPVGPPPTSANGSDRTVIFMGFRNSPLRTHRRSRCVG